MMQRIKDVKTLVDIEQIKLDLRAMDEKIKDLGDSL